MAGVSVASAEESSKEFDFDISEETLGEALIALSVQARIGFLYPHDLADRTGINPVRGRYTVTEALNQMLLDTELSADLTQSGVITVSLANNDQNADRKETMSNSKFKDAVLASTAALVVGAGDVGAQDAATQGAEDEQSDELEVIVVTGTNIRGVAPDSSPVLQFDRMSIENAGYSTVDEFIQRGLPQNFAGGASLDSFLTGNRNNAASNQASGVGVNLRGFGNESTLVLLNGRRISGAGTSGAFVDLSMIPLSAIERIDVLTDGASALYGSDAVAGVVNFVLRHDYEGAETRLRYGDVTDGDMEEIQASQTLGTNWSTGNLLVAYEYFDRDPLPRSSRDFVNNAPLPVETDTIPAQTRHSLFVSGRQDVGDRTGVSIFGLYTDRATDRRIFDFFQNDTAFLDMDVSQIALNLAVDRRLSEAWNVNIAATYSETDSDVVNIRPAIDLTTPSNYKYDNLTVDLIADGKLFDVAGGTVRAAIGGQYRDESGESIIEIAPPLGRDVFAVFGELFIPLVGDGNARAGMKRFELSLAGRYDDYSDVGSSFDPKVGILWSPSDGLNIRGTYATTFRAPSLAELDASNAETIVFFLPDPTPADPSNRALSLLAYGGNPNLEPEEATSYTVGFDYSTRSAPDFELSVTYFNIEYESRITSSDVGLNAYTDPNAAPFVTRDPDLAFVNELLSFPSVRNFSGGPFLPEDIEGIVDNRTVNLADAKITGLDVTANYGLETDWGYLGFDLNASYIFEFVNQLTEASPEIDVVDTSYNPVDLRLRGGVSWLRGPWNVNTVVNYVDSYRDVDQNPEARVSSWTTVDLILGYDFGETSASGVLDGLALSLSVQNVFDKDPPFVSSIFGGGVDYDPENADPIGRFVAFQITKSW